ncbi:hypothetical protein BWI93_14600 [Siphonobacter sp. BAB-5385]|uniref:hypothetical protein n=1 Tax=Siphonobacter sp. BAB-5385 TaxID=1864822 RepID=UPI000B9E0D5E|nr:hypothetical protein [Siphonobacter sp. BAB-5385]OZI07557.1 hypothetical protein BWI93_14600 [Siphonobacter sp. BAB-5385]
MTEQIPDWKKIVAFLEGSNRVSLGRVSSYVIYYTAGWGAAMKIWYDDPVSHYVLEFVDTGNPVADPCWQKLLTNLKSENIQPSTDIEYDEGEETGFQL